MADYEISGTDPKTGEVATYQFSAPNELSNEQLLRMRDRYFAKDQAVPTESALPTDGTQGSTGLAIARTVAREAPAVLGATLAPEAVPLVEGGVATLGRMGARAGLAAAGDAVGRTAGEAALPATPGEQPAGGIAGPALAAGAQFMFDGAGKALFTPSGKQVLATRLTEATRFGQPAIQTETAAGRIVKDALPRVNNTVNKASRNLYAKVRYFGRGIPDAPQPNTVTQMASDLLDGLAKPADMMVPDQLARTRQILERIKKRGQTTTTASKTVLDKGGEPLVTTSSPKPVKFTDLLRDQRELQEELGKYQDRFNPNSTEGGIMNKLSTAVHGEIIRRAKGTPAEAAMIAATDNFRYNVVPFREGFRAAMTDAIGPADVIDVYARAGRPDRLHALYKQLPDYERQQFSSAWFTKHIGESMDQTTGVFDPAQFLGRWKELGVRSQGIVVQGEGRRIGEVIDQLARLQRKADMVASAKKYGTGTAVLGALYASIHAANNGEVSKAAAYLSGAAAPFILPQLLASPRMVKFLNEGMKAPEGSKVAARYGRMIAQTLTHTVGALTQLTEPAYPAGTAADAITASEP